METDPHCISLAAAWEPPADPGALLWVRRFGRPAGSAASGAAAEVRVFLVVTGAASSLRLNGVSLPGGPTPVAGAATAPADEGPRSGRRYDVTGLLGARNELQLTAAAMVPVAGPRVRHGRVALPEAVGEVWLEVVADTAPDPP